MVFENRVLRRIFGLRRSEMTGDWRKRHNEELHNSNFTPNRIRMITSNRVAWKIHVERMGEKEIHAEFWWENQKIKYNCEDLNVNGRLMLRWISEK